MDSQAAALPEWLEHYLQVPAWVIYVAMPSEKILWVNERLADELEMPRDWFVGRAVTEVWTDSHKRHSGGRAMAERRSIDVIGDGQDLKGNWRWLDARLTPVDDAHLFVVCQDISARIKLAGLRLTLGHGFTSAMRDDFSEAFARQLLEGASLEEICHRQNLEPVQVLAKLGRLIGEQEKAPGLQLPPHVELPEQAAAAVPHWVTHYWDLPGPTILLDYPELVVLWVNREVLERNHVRSDDVVGIDAAQVWKDIPGWQSIIERAMSEQRAVDAVHHGISLRGRQQWMSVRVTPISNRQLLIFAEDVTADIRLQALRLLLGLNPEGTAAPAHISDAFARLLLSGASVANIASALEMSADEVRGQAALLLGRAT